MLKKLAALLVMMNTILLIGNALEGDFKLVLVNVIGLLAALFAYVV